MRYTWAPDTPIRVGWIAALLASIWAAGVARPVRRAHLLAAAIILITVTLLYSPSIGYGFLRDDFLFARPVSASQLLSTFWGDWAFGRGTQYYRPIVAASLALDYELWGADPTGYHLTSLALFALAALIGFALLERLTGSAPAALVGVVAWLCHPMSTAAAVWANQRTDSIMAVFYLGTLWLMLRPRFGPRTAVAAAATCALALGSKEMAVTLPLLAGIAVLLVAPPPVRPRLYGVGALSALTTAYLVFWISLFPDKAARAAGPAETGGVAELLPRMLVPIFAPVDYGTWLREWQTAEQWPELLWLALAAGAVAALLWRLAPPRALRVFAFAVAWALLTPLPTVGRGGIPDTYRLGFLIAFASAIAVSALAAALEPRPLVRSLLAGALALWLVPVANRSAAAWSPGGFHYQQLMLWDRDNPEFQSSLTPAMRRRFEQQLRNNVRSP